MPKVRRSRKKTPRPVSAEASPVVFESSPSSPKSPTAPVEPPPSLELPLKRGARVVPLRKSPSSAAMSIPRDTIPAEAPKPKLKRLEVSPKRESISATPKQFASRLVSLRKDGLRVPLPNVDPPTSPKAGEKVEFGASFITTTPRKRRPPVESESITFSPSPKPSSHKRPAGGQIGGIKA